MNILIINPILYTPKKNIQKVPTIMDTMIYDLCLAFYEAGHNVVLYAGEPYKPEKQEEYPFKVRWGKCVMTKVFMPRCFPFMPQVYRYIKRELDKIDLIISSEVFSVNSLLAYRAAKNKLIIWHELAKHNRIMKKIPSKIWYGYVARYLMRDAHVVARSIEAQTFIKKYCRNTDGMIIDHGVNLKLFQYVKNKDNCFSVCSQLIERKRIDGIIDKFALYLKKYNPTTVLYIIGDGDLMQELKKKVDTLCIKRFVVFTGVLNHEKMIPFLARSMAMLVNTVKDNSMVSIVESIAVGTPVITTNVPLNVSYIRSKRLGIAKDDWNEDDLNDIVTNNRVYVDNCINYRSELSTETRVRQFLGLIGK